MTAFSGHHASIIVFAIGIASAVSFAAAAAQPSAAVREIFLSRRPILEMIRPGERHLRILSTRFVESPHVPDGSYVASIVESSPVIFGSGSSQRAGVLGCLEFGRLLHDSVVH